MATRRVQLRSRWSTPEETAREFGLSGAELDRIAPLYAQKAVSEREETPLEEYIMVLAKKISEHRERDAGSASA